MRSACPSRASSDFRGARRLSRTHRSLLTLLALLSPLPPASRRLPLPSSHTTSSHSIEIRNAEAAAKKAADANARGCFDGATFAITGQFQSMSRDEIVSLVSLNGGKYVKSPSGTTSTHHHHHHHHPSSFSSSCSFSPPSFFLLLLLPSVCLCLCCLELVPLVSRLCLSLSISLSLSPLTVNPPSYTTGSGWDNVKYAIVGDIELSDRKLDEIRSRGEKITRLDSVAAFMDLIKVLSPPSPPLSLPLSPSPSLSPSVCPTQLIQSPSSLPSPSSQVLGRPDR